MKIIFGGSFNPPTIAHIAIYKMIKSKFSFDKFIFLPVSTLYHKNKLASNTDRFNMLSLLKEGYDDIEVSKDELDDKKYLGTYHYLKSLNEDAMFLIGSDNLRDLPTWINFEKLIEEFKFLVISRDAMNDEEYIMSHDIFRKNSSNFILIKGFDMRVSSSDFRSSHNKDLLDSKVYNYIKEKGLYGVDNE